MSKNLLIIIVIILIAGGACLVLNKKHSSSENNTVPKIISKALPTPQPTIEATPTAITSSGAKKTTQNTTTTATSPTSGTISCDYEIPATPNNFGTVQVTSNWNSLVAGKNGYKVDLCVSSDGGATQKLMASKTKVSGSSTDEANFISLSSNYIFTIYDEHGGDMPECGGTYLTSCQIHTWQLPTPKPTSSR